MNKVEDGTYIVIQSFMVNELDLTHNEFVLYADKTWVNNEGKEGSTKAIETDDLQLKIINILKSYIQYKISN